jgi:hypothetical protein
MIPAVGGVCEAVALCDNVEEDEEALFDADVGRELRLDVVEDPIGEVYEGDLIHVAEVVEAVGDAHEQVYGPLCAARFLDGHGASGRWSGQQLASLMLGEGAELSGETGRQSPAMHVRG